VVTTDRSRARELLTQAWQHPPAHALERVEMLLSALVHAVLAASETLERPGREESRSGITERRVSAVGS
jgi:hypothetical protein